MSLWKKILLTAAAAVAVLAAGGAALYHFVIVPKYIEPVIASAADALKDSEIQDMITDVAEDLAGRGVIDEETFENYMRKAEKYTSAGAASEAASELRGRYSSSGRTASGTGRVSSAAEEETESRGEEELDETTVQSQSAKSSLGVANIKTSEGVDPADAKINESYSSKFSAEGRREEQLEEDLEFEEQYTFDEGEEEELDPAVQEALSESRAKRIYQNIMSAMSLHERTVFWSVIEKADTDRLMTMYQTSDEEGAKEYLKSILNNDEYSEAVEIFFKYAPLLLEE